MEDAATGVSDLASARQTLAELEARGARGYDAPACDCVHALLMRADELGGGIAQRLSLRAHAHLSSLRARFDADSARVTQRLEAFEAERGEQTALRTVLASGDLVRVARRVRRLRAAPAAPTRALALKQPAGKGFAAPGGHSLRRKRVTAYEDSVAQMVATLAMARATDVVPEDAGPYNPLRVASELLERMRAISPFYLAVQLNRLEELGSLLSLPELPESELPKGRFLQQAEAQKKQKKARLKR
jgi:hypothetical protein